MVTVACSSAVVAIGVLNASTASPVVVGVMGVAAVVVVVETSGVGVAGVTASLAGAAGVGVEDADAPITRSYVSRNLGSKLDSDVGSIIPLLLSSDIYKNLSSSDL